MVSRGGKVVARVTLGQRTLIGRSEHNDVCLPSPYLSRHHAVIVGTPEGYYLVDLNSVNGVLLNGQRIERAVLCDEDVLAMGPFRLKVQMPESLTQGSPFPDAAVAHGNRRDAATSRRKHGDLAHQVARLVRSRPCEIERDCVNCVTVVTTRAVILRDAFPSGTTKTACLVRRRT